MSEADDHRLAARLAPPFDEGRRHYLELAAPELVLCEVIGQFPIASPDGTDVNPGGHVALDPVETNIKALVYCGHVRIVPAQKAATKTATKE